MQSLMRDTFAYDRNLINDPLVESRYTASLRKQAAFASMFPAPRQRWVDAMSHSEQDIRGIAHPTLMVHGRDDKVIPLSTSLTLNQWIDDSQVHIFSRCGHWTQIEKGAEFCRLLSEFFKD
jgi:2-hydroxymuconate-semialdehyde hydrolase